MKFLIIFFYQKTKESEDNRKSLTNILEIYSSFNNNNNNTIIKIRENENIIFSSDLILINFYMNMNFKIYII